MSVQRYQDAIREFHLSVQASFYESESLGKIAWCFYRCNDWNGGLHYANQALSFDPENITALEAKAANLVSLGRAFEGKKLLCQILELAPERAYSHYLLSWFFIRSRQWDEALIKIDEALRLDPYDPLYLNERSKILLEVGRASEAQEASDAALYLQPERAGSHFQRGLVLRAQGDREEAVKAFCEAVRQDPNNMNARHELVETIRCRFVLYRLCSNVPGLISRTPSKVFLQVIGVGYAISVLFLLLVPKEIFDGFLEWVAYFIFGAIFVVLVLVGAGMVIMPFVDRFLVRSEEEKKLLGRIKMWRS